MTFRERVFRRFFVPFAVPGENIYVYIHILTLTCSWCISSVYLLLGSLDLVYNIIIIIILILLYTKTGSFQKRFIISVHFFFRRCRRLLLYSWFMWRMKKGNNKITPKKVPGEPGRPAASKKILCVYILSTHTHGRWYV